MNRSKEEGLVRKMPSLTREIRPGSDLHKFLVAQLSQRIKYAEIAHHKQEDKWRTAEDSVLAYVPESELDAKRRKARDNEGKPRYTTIKIPYSFSLLMAAHTYWTSVFFARNPVHQFGGRHGETEQQVQALEAIVDYQIDVGGAMGPYYLWLYDAGKYGHGVLGQYWDRELIRYSTIEVNPESGEKIQVTRELEGFEGNRVYNVSPWDFYPDPRVTVGQFQKGEYCCVDKRISWNDIITREAQGYYTNVDLLRKGDRAGKMSTGDSQLERPEDDSFSFSDFSGDTPGNARHPAVVRGWEVYVRLIPKEWKLGGSPFPEVWAFTITWEKDVIFGAQPLGAIHNRFPFHVIESEIEGYGQWKRGIIEIVEPVQNTMDWLINTHFFNVRAALNNIFMADPTRVVMKDLENVEEGGVIRIKPEAFGADLDTFFKQIPIRDVTTQHIGDLQVMNAIGERILGINDQIMGVLATGGRKTATEVRTSTGFGVNRLKTLAEYMSACGFSDHAQMVVQNTQQYYSVQKKFKLVGDLAREAGPKFMMVTPDDIAGFYSHVPIDGVLPVDRLAQANLWKDILGAISRFPQIMARYDLGRIFGHVAFLAGIKNVKQFEVQVQSDDLLARQAQAGNVVPITGVRQPQTDNRASGLPSPAPSVGGV